MADNDNICCGYVYQHNKTENGESNVRSPQNYYLKIHLIFLTDLLYPISMFHFHDVHMIYSSQRGQHNRCPAKIWTSPQIIVSSTN